MACAECGHEFEDADETRRLNADARFVPLNPRAAKENVGFHWNALATMSWGQLAELYLRAKTASKKGDESLLQQFYQKRLGLPWNEFTEDFSIEQSLSEYLMDEHWEEEADINGVPVRIMTVDVQKGHFLCRHSGVELCRRFPHDSLREDLFVGSSESTTAGSGRE